MPDIIKVRYLSVDGCSKSRQFKTLKGARKFAHECVGEHPDLGSCYAVSFDGVGRITTNIPLQELFSPREEEKDYGPDDIGLRAPTDGYWRA